MEAQKIWSIPKGDETMEPESELESSVNSRMVVLSETDNVRKNQKTTPTWAPTKELTRASPVSYTHLRAHET